ncbi:hypothetical protein [Neobacillus sp. SAB-20_R2A]|uniref:hypothetical protein n=1 Tax=Neobacillus sp. SAB-20_R2A TaxID=3120519 RepID=UPI003C6E5A8F
MELWSTERLQFEPKNWMKEMRDDLRNQLKLIAPVKEGTLYCKFCTRENDSFFDIENVLLYNVGSGSFSHISNDHIIIERSFENLSNDKIAQTFNHYHLYNYTSRENINLYWEKDQTAVSWTGMQLPVLPDKPHEYWYRMKHLNLTTKLPTLTNETNFGIKINLGVPKGKRVNLTGICKPLIDGIVSAFHSYFGGDLEEMADRLGRILDEEANDIRILLLEDQSAILGKREVVRRFQKGIQWNPADDFCYQIELKTFNTIGTNWIIDGELYTVKEVN